jgi:hypothetical protein
VSSLSPTFRFTVLFPSLWRHTRIAALLPAIISWRAAYGGRRRNKLRKRRQWAACSLRREPVFPFHFSKQFLVRQNRMLVLLTIVNARTRNLCVILYCKTHVSLLFRTLQKSKRRSIYVGNRTHRLVKRRSVYVYGVRFCTVLHRTNSIYGPVQMERNGQFSLIGETMFVGKKRTRNFKRTSAVQKRFLAGRNKSF